MKIKSSLAAALVALLAPLSLAAAPELTVAFFTFGTTPKDIIQVQDEVSKIAQAKIGATVKFLPISISSWNQQINLMLASGESLDLIVSGASGPLSFNTLAAKGQIYALDDYVGKFGKGISAAMDPAFLSAGKVEGKLYAVPSVRDFASALGVDMRNDVLDKLKIDPASVKSYDDLIGILRKVKAAYPDLAPLGPGIQENSFVDFMYSWDSLGDGFGVLMDHGSSLKVVNLYETKDYAAMLKKVRSWYQEGLLQQDASTNKDHWAALVRADKIFSVLTTIKPGLQAQVTKEAGQEMRVQTFVPPFATTTSVANVMWAVPRNSKNPDKAVQFLNLMYSDPAVINLFDWGIEGKHYVKTADGHIDYPAGVDATNTGYGTAMGWLFGNQLLSYIWKGDSLTLYKDLDAFNKTALKSKALGFTFDNSSVKTEVAAVTNALNKYKLAIECGIVDPDKVLPEMQKALKAAGIDKIIAEKQRQLDAWAKSNGVK